MAAQISASASVALSNTDTILVVTNTTSAETSAQVVPDQCYLVHAHLQLDTIVSATSITWFLAADAVGDVPITHTKTSTISKGSTDATDGAVIEVLDVYFHRFSSGVSDTMYVVARTNAGTCNAVARITWTIRA